MADHTDPSEKGFTLVEVLMATALLAVLSTGVIGLFGVSFTTALQARRSTTETMLASGRMEDLRGLRFGFDPLTFATVSDETTDLSTQPATSSGHGLRASPPDALRVNHPGYFDFLDRHGRWVSTGDPAPRSATYLRRWSVQPLPTDGSGTLILRVLVTTVTAERRRLGPEGPRAAHGDEVVVTSVRARTGRGL